MPDVLDQNKAVEGAAFSICGHKPCLKETFSGPCSWTISAESNADESVEDRTSCFDSSNSAREGASVLKYPEKLLVQDTIRE